jgi:glucosamine-6-phosphate deaminase
MEVIIAKDYDGMSRIAAHHIAREIRKKQDLVLGLATGGTPVGTYQELVRLHREEGLDFSKVTTTNTSSRKRSGGERIRRTQSRSRTF